MLASKNRARALSRSGLKLIKLSFWGDTKAEYESRNRMQSFEKAIEKAKGFIEHTEPSTTVVINIVKYRRLGQSLEPDLEFKSNFKDYPNVKFYCFYGSDWRGMLDIAELKVPLEGEPKKAPCNTAGKILPVSWDGRVAFCWLDFNREYVLGDYLPGSLLQYWRSESRLKILRIMAKGRFKDMELCRKCSAPYSEDKKSRTYQDRNLSEVIVGKMLYDDDFLDHIDAAK
jgi:radical SAM protein with 4Fe4S-binding SPASM domain